MKQLVMKMAVACRNTKSSRIDFSLSVPSVLSAITVFYAASLHHNCLSTAWSTAICHLNTSTLDSTKADFLFFFLLE